MSKPIRVLFGVFGSVLIIATAIVAGVYFLPNSFTGPTKTETIIIKANQTGAEIAQQLHERGLVRSPMTFRMALRLLGKGDKLQEGYYQVPNNTNLYRLIHILQDGRVQAVKVTIPEGYTLGQINELLQKEPLLKAGDFMEQAKTFVPYMYMYGPQPVSYRDEGFLFPSTYEIPVNSTGKDVIQIMTKEMNKRLTPEIRAELERQHMTIFEFITLASLVEKEAKYDEDREVIAAIFKKRLAIGMPLQSCASIQYILGYPKPLLSIEDTQLQSPYNTYLHKGLPPGPIANPGMKAMESVLYAKPTEYLFFVADEKGHHTFSQTYEEHLKAVETIYGK